MSRNEPAYYVGFALWGALGAFWIWVIANPPDRHRWSSYFVAGMGLFASVINISAIERARLRALRESRQEAGLCLRCGYDLRGNTSGVCPECGTPVAR